MNMRSARSALALVTLGAGATLAATYTVTNNGDTATGGTLRWAINGATTNPGPDTIAFALSSTTITPTAALPSLSDLEAGTVIDGTTQPGYAGTPLVKLVGTSAGSAGGLFINTPNNVVKGLIITRFQGSGIVIASGHNVVSGNYVISNLQDGVYVYGGVGSTIGGTNATDRNVISGNGNYGVHIAGDDVAQNAVLGNYIGVDPTGLLGTGNAWSGVMVQAPSNRVGSAAAGGRNIIAANGYVGIVLSGSYAHHNTIEGNYCGVNAGGSTARPNVSGIQLAGASHNTIGGATPGAGNVLSGNINYGIDFQPGCHSNTVLGNFIGTDAAGSSMVSNKYDGIIIAVDNGDNQIGGADATGRNVISGNGYRGIMVGANTGLVIRGNSIGVSTSGTRLGNGMSGICLVDCSRVTVGGTNVNARNVIGGNDQGIWVNAGASNTVRFNYIGVNADGTAVGNNSEGILVDGRKGHTISDNVASGNGTYGIRLNGPAGCVLQRNLIGTDPTGTAARGNHSIGLCLQNGASNTVIGGRWADGGNVISGNDLGGVSIEGLTTRNTILRGNRIGTDISGMTAISNRYSGIGLADSPMNTIGSATNSDERNVISGNAGQGIDIAFSNSFGNLIAGNYVGTDASGTHRLPNVGAGIWIHQASTNTVGGTGTGAVNRIAYNVGSGIQVESGDGNRLLNNSIYRNDVLGIDLGLGTVTPNDPGDSDTGANRLQNYPVLVSASNNGSQIRVVWTLDSVPGDNFILEFYGSTGPDRSSYGEGEYALGSIGPLTTPLTGLLGGTNWLTTPSPPPNFVTALATHATRLDTSEFSQRIMLDSDNDGLPDGYETVYFGGYTNGQPNAHADSDGVSNIDEFTADTDPLDSNAFPRVKSISVPGNTFVLTAPCSAERTYQVQVCTNLLATPPLWPVCSVSFVSSGDEGRFTGSRTNAAYYRITIALP